LQIEYFVALTQQLCGVDMIVGDILAHVDPTAPLRDLELGQTRALSDRIEEMSKLFAGQNDGRSIWQSDAESGEDRALSMPDAAAKLLIDLIGRDQLNCAPRQRPFWPSKVHRHDAESIFEMKLSALVRDGEIARQRSQDCSFDIGKSNSPWVS
jgi:hypothetical protein